KLKGKAQEAIDEAWDELVARAGVSAPDAEITVGDFAETWTEEYPRAERTNKTNDYRVGVTLDIDVEGRPFRDWPMAEVRRKHVLVLVDHMLRVHGRATTGVTGILGSLSA